MKTSLSSEGDSVSGSVGEDFPGEQARVRGLLEIGLALGPAGAFYVRVCRAALEQAERAAMSGDPVAILQAYQELLEIKE